VAEIARLGRTLRAWRQQFLAYFDTGGVSNGGTEAINLLIEKTRRLAHAGPRQSRWSCGQDQADGPRDVASVVSQGCGDVGVSRAA